MGIGYRNTEGYADPTAYEAEKNADIFRIDHPTGYISLHTDAYFPCPVKQAQKLFRFMRKYCSQEQKDR